MSATQTRPPQASPTEPHWIILCLSEGQEEPTDIRRKWRKLFRHPSEVLANAECARLAAARPGRRFAVYGSGMSFKVVKPGLVETEATPAEPA
jgi:hypothetical protein